MSLKVVFKNALDLLASSDKALDYSPAKLVHHIIKSHSVKHFNGDTAKFDIF